MQTCGRSSRRARFSGIDSLIPFAIDSRIVPANIERQGNMSNTLQDGKKIGYRSKSQSPLAIAPSFDHFGHQLRFLRPTIWRVEEQLLSQADFPPRTDQGLPFPRSNLTIEQDLDRALHEIAGRRIARTHGLGACSRAAGKETRRKDSGVVEYE